MVLGLTGASLSSDALLAPAIPAGLGIEFNRTNRGLKDGSKTGEGAVDPGVITGEGRLLYDDCVKGELILR